MIRLRMQKPRGFSLRAASDFYASFTPGSGMAAAAVDQLTLAFRLDHSFDPVAVALREADSALVLDVAGTDDRQAVRQQVARMLGLEPGADAWLELGERDPVVGSLQREFPGFFTAAKSSPYDAATWSVITPRMHQRQAAAIKQAMARELGDRVELHGRAHHVFPAPTVLASLRAFPGLAEEKVARLRGIAEAALAGRLDAERLRALGETRALAELQTLRGIGPWAASHVYFRGAAPRDGLPTAEPRVLHGLAHAYRIEAPSAVTFARLAESWRPFRMWVCVLLSRHLARTDGWHAPGLARERAAAGRELARRATSATRATRPTRALATRQA
jgi:DNA-3-methyladenine glycosylase II